MKVHRQIPRSGALAMPRLYRLKFSLVLSAMALGSLALVIPSLADAQTLYRIVGADGKVTFSDKPPAPDSKDKVAAPVKAGSVSASPPSSGTGLPFELRQVAARFPVTLYTSANCVPCGSARALLTSRGVPFTEKMVTTDADAQALKRLSNETSLPFATIGSQQLKGFADTEWTQFLNAAGYPAASVLPSSYRPPAATPLVAVAPAPADPAAPAATSAAANNNQPASTTGAGVPVAPPVSNPAGIKF